MDLTSTSLPWGASLHGPPPPHTQQKLILTCSKISHSDPADEKLRRQLSLPQWDYWFSNPFSTFPCSVSQGWWFPESLVLLGLLRFIQCKARGRCWQKNAAYFKMLLPVWRLPILKRSQKNHRQHLQGKAHHYLVKRAQGTNMVSICQPDSKHHRKRQVCSLKRELMIFLKSQMTRRRYHKHMRACCHLIKVRGAHQTQEQHQRETMDPEDGLVKRPLKRHKEN